VDPTIAVIGVQSAAAPAAYQSWRRREPVAAENHTRAEGLATGSSFELPQRILRERLDDFVLVTDDEMEAALRLMIENTRTLVEMAGAAPLAGALRLRERLAGKRVCLVASGGNITPEQLQAALSAS
jgi:threonine dehydratase